MTQQRDDMHATGGAVMAAQLEREKASAAVASSEKKRVARSSRTYLDMVDDHDLVDWLKTRTPKWGETLQEVFEEAREAFPKMDKLNRDHIRTRMEKFADRLPKASPPVVPLTVEQRLERAERLLAHFAGWLAAGDMSQEGRNEVAAYYTNSNVA